MPLARVALWADHVRRGESERAHQETLLYHDSVFFWRNLMRGSCLGHLGRLEEGRAEVAELLRRKPDFTGRWRNLIARILKQPELQARVADGLGRAGLDLA